jgi:AraC family transcriptional regulator
MLLSETALNVDRSMSVQKSTDALDWSNLNISIVDTKPYDYQLMHGGSDDLWISMTIDPLDISVITNRQKFDLNLAPNQLCIHAPYAVLGTVRKNESRLLHAFLKRNLLSEVLGELFDRDASDIEIVSRLGVNDADIAEMLQIFHNSLLRSPELHQMKMEYLARALAIDIFRKHLPLPHGRGAKVFDRRLTVRQIRNVIGHIQENLLSNVTLSDLSDISGLSRTTFIQQFKSTFKETPHQYIIRARILKAQELLVSTNIPMANIALTCGFFDQAHFSKYFRRITGTTPSTYRRQI